MKPIECGSCDYLHYLPRTMYGTKGVQLVCGKIKKEITWFESHRPFSDDFQPEWCPRRRVNIHFEAEEKKRMKRNINSLQE